MRALLNSQFPCRFSQKFCSWATTKSSLRAWSVLPRIPVEMEKVGKYWLAAWRADAVAADSRAWKALTDGWALSACSTIC